MDEEQQKDLTAPENSDILTTDEKRILANLRNQAKEIHSGEFDLTFKVHHNALTHGYITAIRKRI